MFVPTRLFLVAFLPTEFTDVLTCPSFMDLGAGSALIFELLLLWVLLRFSDLVDPARLLEGALLGYIICFLAEDICGDFFKGGYVGLYAHLFNKVRFYAVTERICWEESY